MADHSLLPINVGGHVGVIIDIASLGNIDASTQTLFLGTLSQIVARFASYEFR